MRKRERKVKNGERRAINGSKTMEYMKAWIRVCILHFHYNFSFYECKSLLCACDKAKLNENYATKAFYLCCSLFLAFPLIVVVGGGCFVVVQCFAVAIFRRFISL